jgi:hypothetical protein
LKLEGEKETLVESITLCVLRSWDQPTLSLSLCFVENYYSPDINYTSTAVGTVIMLLRKFILGRRLQEDDVLVRIFFLVFSFHMDDNDKIFWIKEF